MTQERERNIMLFREPEQKSSLVVTELKIWNEITDKLKNCNYQSFKKAYKFELLSKYK